MSHAELVTQLLLDLSKIPHCRVWKNHVGLAKTESRVIRYGLPGSADITGILKTKHGGIRLEIECKVGPDKLSQKQINFKNMIETLGGIYKVARPESVANLIKELSEWKS